LDVVVVSHGGPPDWNRYFIKKDYHPARLISPADAHKMSACIMRVCRDK
jgi:hypothetical protein